MGGYGRDGRGGGTPACESVVSTGVVLGETPSALVVGGVSL
jgi:hypothetical protein